MCGFDWELFLEYLKLLFSWPVIVLALTLFLTTKFRESLNDLIGRVTKGEILGTSFEASLVQTTFKPAGNKLEEAGQMAGPNSRDAELPLHLRDDPAVQRAVAIARDLPVQTVLYYRQTLFWLNYERVFARIFGTQVSALVDLEDRSAQAPFGNLERFYTEHQKLIDHSNYPIEAYFGFLEAFFLVERKGKPGEYVYSLTLTGKEFLHYIRANYPDAWDKRVY